MKNSIPFAFNNEARPMKLNGPSFFIVSNLFSVWCKNLTSPFKINKILLGMVFKLHIGCPKLYLINSIFCLIWSINELSIFEKGSTDFKLKSILGSVY